MAGGLDIDIDVAGTEMSAALLIATLAGFNIVSALIQRPLVLLAIRYVRAGSPGARRLNTALHVLWLLLYAALVLACAVAVGPHPAALLVLLVLAVAARAALFEPILNNGLPGRKWGQLGTTAAYDRFRRRLGERLNVSPETVGGASNVLAAVVALAAAVALVLI